MPDAPGDNAPGDGGPSPRQIARGVRYDAPGDGGPALPSASSQGDAFMLPVPRREVGDHTLADERRAKKARFEAEWQQQVLTGDSPLKRKAEGGSPTNSEEGGFGTIGALATVDEPETAISDDELATDAIDDEWEPIRRARETELGRPRV